MKNHKFFAWATVFCFLMTMYTGYNSRARNILLNFQKGRFLLAHFDFYSIGQEISMISSTAWCSFCAMSVSAAL